MFITKDRFKAMFITEDCLKNIQLDMMLKTFKNSPNGFVDNKSLFHEPIEDWTDAIAFLTKEGYLEELRYGYKITYKGKMLIDQGGFSRKYIREVAQHWATIAAGVTSTIAAVASVLALLK